MQKEQFSEWGRGGKNGAMLTTYLSRYTSECTISQSNFRNFFSSRKGALTPLTKILRTLLDCFYYYYYYYYY